MNTLYTSSQPSSNYYSMANGKSYHNSLRRPKYRYENSLPTSPSRTETPLLNLLSDTRSYSPPLSLSLYSPTSVAPSQADTNDVLSPLTRSKRAYQYHNSQLDMYLQEYKTLQHELTRMKQTCDSLTTNKINPKSILKKHTPASVDFLLPDNVDNTTRESRGLDANYWLPRKPFRRRLSTGDFYEN
uniref:Uncharacterized protein n=1 Tax=Cacopsylla melanoneura TaxID=428564 RepID=A0A8D8QEL1_9HEMI